MFNDEKLCTVKQGDLITLKCFDNIRSSWNGSILTDQHLFLFQFIG